MAFNSPKQSFSKRFGYRGLSGEIAIREDAPESLRFSVFRIVERSFYSSTQVRDVILSVLRTRPTVPRGSSNVAIRDEAERPIFDCEWFDFYDCIEKFSSFLTNQGPIESRLEVMSLFEQQINQIFLDDGIGWQLVQGELLTRGSDTFESNVHEVVDALEQAGRVTAGNEIHEALADLSRRPEADLTGAIQHAMAALECVARDICGDEKATLGEVIKRYPGTIPKPLDESVAKAWGYASEMARHIREGRKPERREVELIVSLAATVATYLSGSAKAERV